MAPVGQGTARPARSPIAANTAKKGKRSGIQETGDGRQNGTGIGVQQRADFFSFWGQLQSLPASRITTDEMMRFLPDKQILEALAGLPYSDS